MAIAKGGILGTYQGKIGNVVGQKWKGKNTIRTLVTPSNPKTPAQIAQRAAFDYVRKVITPVYKLWSKEAMRGFPTKNTAYNELFSKSMKTNEGVLQDIMPCVMIGGDTVELGVGMWTFAGGSHSVTFSASRGTPNQYQSYRLFWFSINENTKTTQSGIEQLNSAGSVTKVVMNGTPSDRITVVGFLFRGTTDTPKWKQCTNSAASQRG
jgi:hypothetical protein